MTANTLALCVATMNRPSAEVSFMPLSHPDVATWLEQAHGKPPVHYWYNDQENLGVVGAYQKLYETTSEDILLFIHDDAICREQDWDLRLMAEFIADPQVAVVGFGGALWHGLPDLYKVPYQLQQLQRGDYRSNVDDAEGHGERFTGSCNVAVLDGFALAMRRSFLDRIEGFAKISEGCNFLCYDYALCALARRYKQQVRMVGIRCHHRGGVTSVSSEPSVKQYVNQEAYDKSHLWFYKRFADVMPARVKP
jgi:GT2 family glycosyltransferase